MAPQAQDFATRLAAIAAQLPPSGTVTDIFGPSGRIATCQSDIVTDLTLGATLTQPQYIQIDDAHIALATAIFNIIKGTSYA